METLNQKRERMLDVKRLNFFIIIFLLVLNCQGQTIIGKYQKLDPTTASKDIGVQYHFKNNSSFESIVFGHLESKDISKGKFFIKKDTLFLRYEELDDLKEKKVEILNKEKISSLSNSEKKRDPIYIKIQVSDNLDNPLQGANLAMLNSNQKIVFGFMSDNKGGFPELAIYDPYIKKFQISALGKKEILISTDSLFGYRSVLKIYLNDSSSNYLSKNIIEKYLIKEITENKIILISLLTSKKIILKKID